MITQALLVKWQIAVHLTLCTALLLQIIALGMRPRRVGCKKTKAVFVGILAFLIGNIALWFPVYDTITPHSPIRFNQHLLDIWRFIWTPMTTVFILWMYVNHAIKTCKNYIFDVATARVITNPEDTHTGAFLLGGVVTAFLCATVGIEAMSVASPLLSIILSSTICYVCVECIVNKYRNSTVVTPSPVCAWFCGTWLGAWLLSII